MKLKPEHIKVIGINQDNEKIIKCPYCQQEEIIIKGDDFTGYYTDHLCDLF